MVARAFLLAKESLKQGRTELELYGEMNAKIFSEKGPFSWIVGDLVSGRRSLEIGGLPKQKKLEKGDTVILDLQANCRYFWSDLCRTFLVGSRPR